MNQDEVIRKNKELVRKYPFLLPINLWTNDALDDYDYSFTELDAMPDGWRKAFGEQMCEEIAEVLRRENYLNEYRILQIKEKWGFLHWYDNGAPDGVNKVISKYEKISERTCIKCGAPATKISRGWISPWCNSCAEALRDRVSFDEIDEEGGNDLP